MRTRSLLLVIAALAAMCAHSLAVIRSPFPPKPRPPGVSGVIIIIDDAVKQPR